jgi:hypothetical protein
MSGMSWLRLVLLRHINRRLMVVVQAGAELKMSIADYSISGLMPCSAISALGLARGAAICPISDFGGTIQCKFTGMLPPVDCHRR